MESNLSFTATFSKRKPLIFLEKVGGFRFFKSKKCPYGTDMGLGGNLTSMTGAGSFQMSVGRSKGTLQIKRFIGGFFLSITAGIQQAVNQR